MYASQAITCMMMIFEETILWFQSGWLLGDTQVWCVVDKLDLSRDPESLGRWTGFMSIATSHMSRNIATISLEYILIGKMRLTVSPQRPTIFTCIRFLPFEATRFSQKLHDTQPSLTKSHNSPKHWRCSLSRIENLYYKQWQALDTCSDGTAMSSISRQNRSTVKLSC